MGKDFTSPFGRKDIDLLREKGHLQVRHELARILDLLLRIEQIPKFLDLILFIAGEGPAFLVAPVGGDPLFRPFMHRPRPDLDFDPLSVGADHRRMEGLVVVGLRHGDIILEPPRNRFPEGMDDAQRFIAVLLLVRIEDDPEGHQVIDLVEIDVLLLHLFVDAVKMLCPSLHFALDAKPFHLPADDPPDLLGILIPLLLLLHDPPGQFVVGLEVEIPEGKVLQLRLHPVDPQAVGQRCIELQGLLGDVELSLRRLKFQGSHVVDPVRQTDEEDPDIGRHGQDHLPEIFRLSFFLIAEGDLADLGQAVDEKGHILAEGLLDLFQRGQGILDRIVEKTGHDRRRIELHIGQDSAHFHGMGQIGLAGEADLPLMDGGGKNIGLFDHLQFGRGQIGLDLIEDVVDAEHGVYIPSTNPGHDKRLNLVNRQGRDLSGSPGS